MSRSSETSNFLLKKQDIPKLIVRLKQILQVYGPVAHKSQFRFEQILNSAQLHLDYDTTILPPKKFFIPPKQTTLTFSQPPNYEIQEMPDWEEPDWNGKRFVLFGIHSCDLGAIRFHDLIINQLFPDPYRTRRREEGIIIGLYCMTPCPESFCKSMGYLNWNDGADLMLTDLGEEYFVQVFTNAGTQLVEYATKFFTPAKKEVEKRAEELRANREKDFPDPIKNVERLPNQLEESYEGEMWERLGRRCFSCGACTLVCPTCFCFDIQDQFDLSLKQGSRIRKWDSCQLVDFALVAGGHNFRPTISSRVRFRLYHKFRIEPEQVNKIGCVGCGRCTRTCPADIEMIEILTDIQKGGNDNDESSN
jgi:formate hydrogenlyase subunit 6/NADH:ubiquinone oxidoreductase subunit I